MRNSAQLLLASFPSFSPKDISGLVGWYDYGSWNNSTKVWADKSGNGNNATAGNTTYVNSTSVSGNGSSKTINCIEVGWDGGSTVGYIDWPAGILPSTYTLFHVCRYTGAASQRIIQGKAQNWLSGFWAGNGNAFYHNGWIGSVSNVGNNWRYSTDQNNLGRQNGTTIGTSGAGSPSYDRISINNGAIGNEKSICNVAEVIVYNSNISSTDYLRVEDYLKTLYGL